MPVHAATPDSTRSPPHQNSDFSAEISRLAGLSLNDLRAAWQAEFQQGPPKSLTPDLLLRSLAWRLQEKAFGGHDRTTLKILDSHGKGRPTDAQRTRYLKPGTEIVREYQGERHTVTVTMAGFRWRDGDYPSLTAIARIITGTSCNGPRFFGLRMPGEGQIAGAGQSSVHRPAKGFKKAEEPRP